MHWNRLKVSIFTDLLWVLVGWRPSGKKRSETLLFDQILDFQHFVNFGKDRHREMMKIRLIKLRKAWIWDQYHPENMK